LLFERHYRRFIQIWLERFFNLSVHVVGLRVTVSLSVLRVTVSLVLLW